MKQETNMKTFIKVQAIVTIVALFGLGAFLKANGLTFDDVNEAQTFLTTLQEIDSNFGLLETAGVIPTLGETASGGSPGDISYVDASGLWGFFSSGTNGQVLKATSVAPFLYWGTDDQGAAGSGITNVASDTTPTLGGDLDAGGYQITNARHLTATSLLVNGTTTISGAITASNYASGFCTFDGSGAVSTGTTVGDYSIFLTASGTAWEVAENSVTTNGSNWTSAYTWFTASSDLLEAGYQDWNSSNANWDTAYTHSQDNTQAHSDYLLNTGDTGTGTFDFGGADDLEIPNGASPTVDTAGQIALDTTSDQLRWFGGAERSLPYKKSIVATIASSSFANRVRLGKLPYGATITQFDCLVDPAGSGETIAVDLDEEDATADNPATMLGADQICDNDGTSTSTFTNSAIDDGDWWSIDASGIASTTIDYLTVTVEYVVNAD